ncbi:MAG TPA: phosphate ABC transporter substrate-binding protein PstS [Gemmataceae bacterium]|jgi:phosphate transport system substrate-binding protein|nr:phosphate ABC transporter substrate-binding protein PstS [Gemmataceae bacterium]
MRQRLFYVAAVLGFGLASVVGCNSDSGGPGGAKRLSGGGATFIDPLIQEWKQQYQSAKGVEIDYQAKGSGNGIQQMTEKTIDFGCSDAPMNKKQLEAAKEKGGDVVHIPLTMGPVVVAYNLPGVEKPLVLSGPVISDIYLGKIKKWNSKEIQDLNKDTKLPELEIFPLFRAEASGTTNIFTDYLSKVSPEFKEKVGSSTQPTWPKGVGGGERGNDGVANRIKNSAGAVGYVEVRYAKKGGLQYGAIRNKAGKDVMASPEGVTAAAAKAMEQPQTEEPYSLHELTFSLTNADGDDSYPICGISYCVLYKKQPAGTGKALVDFLRWAVHEGQGASKKLDYAPLPEELVKKIDARLNLVEVGK